MIEPISTLTLGAAWLWDKHSDGILEWLQNKAKEKSQDYGQEQWKKFQWRQAEQEYKKKSLELNGWTRVLGNPEPTELTGIFTHLYILSKPLAARRFSIEQLQEVENEKLHGKEVERFNGVGLVNQKNSNRLFILGKPGAGKTTFLKYINLQAIQGHIDKTPIFITLREWMDTDKKLMEYIAEQFSICGFPKAETFIEYLLQKGSAIVLFDGLDEVNEQHNPRIISQIKEFCRKYGKSQCLITCRVAAVDYSFENFKFVEVADFTPDQITAYVYKWFARKRKTRDLFLLGLKEEQHHGLAELARSPLLLGMLCLAFDDSMRFPVRRAELYADAIDALLRKWDSSRSIKRDDIYKNLTPRLKEQLFAAIAYKTFSENKYLLPERELCGYLAVVLKKQPTQENIPEADIVLKAIEAQHGIFVERAQKIHSFAHLTFQEYFAASHIAGSPKFHAELLQHITDPRWREVILLTASLLNDADDFVTAFSKAIDEFIKTDSQLVGLLQWADYKRREVDGHIKNPACRLFYISLARAHAQARDLELDRALALNRTLDLTLARNFEIVLALAHTRANASALDLDLALKLELDFTRAYARALELANSQSKKLACDYLMLINLLQIEIFTAQYSFKKPTVKNYDQTLTFFHDSISQVSSWGFINLTTLIPIFPSKNAPHVQWRHFTKKLREILQSERHIPHDIQLSTAQSVTLGDYLTANSLLLECLNLATVTDREAIKNNLLAPPNS